MNQAMWGGGDGRFYWWYFHTAAGVVVCVWNGERVISKLHAIDW